MNLKNIRKNYDALSLRERYLLFNKAANRNDESEINAIVSVSPKLSYKLVDFYNFHEAVNDLNLVNLLQRLRFQEIFDLLYQKVNSSKSEKFEQALDDLLLCGYLYKTETDAWKLIGDEFGFDVQDFRQKMANGFLTFGLLEIKDELMREVAFTEEGIRKIAAEQGLNLSEVLTIETKKSEYREYLIQAERQAI